MDTLIKQSSHFKECRETILDYIKSENKKSFINK